MRAPVWLGIDLGTQSVRVLAVDAQGTILSTASEPLQSTRTNGRHEQQPELWWNAFAACCGAVMTGLTVQAAHGPVQVEGLAVDATSGTILLMNERLEALTPGLMYDDHRAIDEAVAVNLAGESLWQELSYRMQPSWALPKLLWLSRHGAVPAGARLAHQNDFIHARLAGRLTSADSSNSLKTGYDLIRERWPVEVLDSLGLDPALFPKVVAPGTRIAEVCSIAAEITGLPQGTPIFAGMTDGCAAQIASGAVTPGSWNSVVGTTLVLKGVTRDLLHDPLGNLYSHRSPDGFWLPGGASSVGGAMIARDFAVADLPALNAFALEAAPSAAVLYPLAGRGERYPFAAPEAHEFTLGEVSSTAERYRAVLEGIAFTERLAFDALTGLGADTTGAFTVSGGTARSQALTQIRADVLGRAIHVPRVTEAAFGMAILAAAQASAAGLAETAARMVSIERTVEPRREFREYAPNYVRLLQELERRGWLPPALAALARTGAHA